jgi:hypothetical protein
MADFSLKLEVHLAMPIRDIMNAFILGNDSFICLYNAGHNTCSRKWVTSSFSVPQHLHSGDSFLLLNLCLLISSRYVPVNSRAFILPFLMLETVDDRLVQIGWVDPIFNVVKIISKWQCLQIFFQEQKFTFWLIFTNIIYLNCEQSSIHRKVHT